MIALYIIASVLALIMLLLLLPVSFIAEYDGVFSFKIRFGGIPIPVGREKKTEKTGKHAAEQKNEKPEKKKKSNPFSEIYKREGFSAATRMVIDFAKQTLSHLGAVVKRIKVRNFYLDLRIATENAAETAIEYGAVCSAVYPFLSFVYTLMNIKADRIDIKADFDSKTPSVKFGIKLSLQMISLLIAAVKIFQDYRKLIKDGASDERK